MGQYAFNHQWGKERERLRHFEAFLDPGTIRHLEAIGVAPEWRCLEVGGGAGSITAWLCERVGPDGHVTATDLETSFLNQLSYSNLSVLRHDIVNDDLPKDAFDLVHERAVLEHLPSRDHLLTKLVEALKPGGWILVEGGDHHLVVHTDEPEAPFRDAMKLAVQALADRTGFDPFYGRRLYAALTSRGLSEVSCEGRVYQQPGGTPGASRVWPLVLERFREPLLSAGILSADQFEEVLKGFAQPEYGVMSPIYWAACGRRGQPEKAEDDSV